MDARRIFGSTSLRIGAGILISGAGRPRTGTRNDLRASVHLAIGRQRVPEAGGKDDAEDGHGQQGCDSGDVVVETGGDPRSSVRYRADGGGGERRYRQRETESEDDNAGQYMYCVKCRPAGGSSGDRTRRWSRPVQPSTEGDV